MMNGVTVTVETLKGETGRLGDRLKTYNEPVEVSGVLWARVNDADRDYTRPDGFVVTVTADFPRDCTLDLEGARLTYGGDTVYVDGKPAHVPSPLKWDMPTRAGVYV